MPPRVARAVRGGRRRTLVSASRDFYPSEVARILKLEYIDYVQLRRLHALVAPDEARRTGRWIRFTVPELVAAAAAVELLGGREAFGRKSRLPWHSLESACRLLREHYGIAQPLQGMHLTRNGDRIVAHHRGISFEPTGQAIFGAVEKGIMDHSRRRPVKGPDKGEAGIHELHRFRDRLPARRARSELKGTLVLVVDSHGKRGM